MLAILAAALLAPAPGTPVPKYDGKPLDYWVQKLQKAETDADRDAAARALVAFGPDAAPALPTFIEMLADHSDNYRLRVVEIVAAIGPKARDARSAVLKPARDGKTIWVDKYVRAAVAISSGPKDAAEALSPLLDSTHCDFCAYRALCELGPEAKGALPAVQKYVLARFAARQKDDKASIPDCDKLSNFGPAVVPLLVEMLDGYGWRAQYAALSCIRLLGPDAKDAVPAVVKLLKDDEPETRLRTAVNLCAIEKNLVPVEVLADLVAIDPELTYYRESSSRDWESIAVAAARALGDLGPDAKAALPKLQAASDLGLLLTLLVGKSPYRLVSEGGSATMYPLHAPYDEHYKRWRRVEAYTELGRAAREAIDKIERRTK
jgi:HEAT repeat protein